MGPHVTALPDPWPLLAALARQNPEFLACALQQYADADLAITLGIPRKDVWRLLVCLTPRSEHDVLILTEHFKLAPGSLATLLWGNPRYDQPSVPPRTMQRGGAS